MREISRKCKKTKRSKQDDEVNKAGYKATLVACGWEGAVKKKTNQEVEQEQ